MTLHWFHYSAKQKTSFVSQEKGGYFANVISRKRTAKQQKKIQGDIFPFSWKPHAKPQALLRTKKHTHNKISHIRILGIRMEQAWNGGSGGGKSLIIKRDYFHLHLKRFPVLAPLQATL